MYSVRKLYLELIEKLIFVGFFIFNMKINLKYKVLYFK